MDRSVPSCPSSCGHPTDANGHRPELRTGAPCSAVQRSREKLCHCRCRRRHPHRRPTRIAAGASCANAEKQKTRRNEAERQSKGGTGRPGEKQRARRLITLSRMRAGSIFEETDHGVFECVCVCNSRSLVLGTARRGSHVPQTVPLAGCAARKLNKAKRRPHVQLCRMNTNTSYIHKRNVETWDNTW